MKKLLFIALVAFCSLCASAQVEKGFRMGVQANVGISDVIADGSSVGVGYGLGWIAEYNFSSHLFLQSGIGLQNIAHKESGIDGTLNAFYGQLPLHVGYRFGIGETTSMSVQAGPTFGVGIFGTKIDFGYNTYSYFDLAERFDLGVGGRIGVEFNNLQISVGANYGVLEVFDGIGGNNLSANIGIAYMF